MGLDVSGQVIVGIKFTMITRSKEVVYYDKMTGKPYKEEKEELTWFCEGLPEVHDIDEGTDDEQADWYYNCDECIAVFGICVSETDLRDDEESHLALVDKLKLGDALNYMESKYPNAPIEIYNFLSFSC